MSRYDARVKIQKTEYKTIENKVSSIMEEYGTSQNFAINKIADEYSVNPKTIYWIVNPEQKEKDRAYTRKQVAKKYKKERGTKEFREKRAQIARRYRLKKKQHDRF